ncbi:MAG: hypothetical protein JW862_09010 [Anaerolineales bacterium]|nr:hypothetical protein [Anaerolineales bacterium]
MHPIIFTTLALPGKAALEVLLLAASLRQFGGQLADSPIWAGVPAGMDHFDPDTLARFETLKVEILPIPVPEQVLKFPFAAKVIIAAALERRAHQQGERFAFLDRDTLILQEPAEFLLPAKKQLGYRPVHHRLIGPAHDQPADSFWQLLYQACKVPPGHLFPMTTHIGEQIGPYFNAGVLVTRPQASLLQRWQTAFLNLYQQPEIAAYYQQDQRYAIFVHQAVLTAVLLATLEPDQMQAFTARVNYPLHLHRDVPSELRPARVGDLVTARYEDIFDQPGWQTGLPFDLDLVHWLQQQPRIQAEPWEAT